MAVDYISDGAMMSLAKRHLAFRESVASFYFDCVLPLGRGAIAIVILVVERIYRIIKDLQPGIAGVWLVHGTGPAEMFVVANGRQWTSEECGAGKIQPLCAAHMRFVKLTKTEVRLMRI